MRRIIHAVLGAGLWLALAWAPAVRGQAGEVGGVVRDAATGDPMPLVNVTLRQGEVVVAGAATDGRGRFRLPGVAPGDYRLVARYVGFRTVERAVTVAGAPVAVDLRMEAVPVGMEEVEVRADPFPEREGVARLRPGVVRRLAGGGEDVVQALRTLPGVLTASDFSNQLLVRGGTPDQNLILLDGIEVFNPYQLNGTGSLLNPLLVRRVDLYAGAFPAVFGDRLSSVLAVETRDGSTGTRLGGQVSTNLTTAGAVFEGRTGFWDGSWLVSGRRTYFDTFASTFARRTGVFNDIAFPDFADVQGKLTLRPSRRHLVRLTGLLSRDDLDFVAGEDAFGEQEGAGRSLVDGGNTSRNAALGLVWRYVPDARRQVQAYVNGYRATGASDLAGGLVPRDGALPGAALSFTPPAPVFGGVPDTVSFRFDQAYRLQKVGLGARGWLETGRHRLEADAGLDVLENALDLDLALNAFGRLVFDAMLGTNPLVGALADRIDARRVSHRVHGYLTDRLALGGGLFVEPGLRYDYYGLIRRGYLSPRIHLAWDVGPVTTLRLAAGRYVQSPGFEKLLDPDNLFNLARYSRLDSLRAEEAVHLGAGLTYRPGGAWEVRVEGYWKRLRRLLTQATEPVTRTVAEFAPTGGDGVQQGRLDAGAYRIRERTVYARTPAPVNAGDGTAYGVEVLVERRRGDGPWSGWLSYALARADRTLPAGPETVRRPFDYDRRHTLSLVLDRRLGRRLHLALTWRFGSGFAYTPARGVEPLVATVADPATGDVRGIILTDPATGHVRLVPRYGEARNVNTDRLPAYHRLDVRLTYLVRWHRRALELYLDLINVYNRRNVQRYQYVIEVVDPPPGLPGALTPPPKPVLFRQPVFMFPFIPSFGFSFSF